MSMLADRKRRNKWSLNPQGKLWSQDTNKVGQKLLEKMGWSHGKGLGANENGITEHVKVSYKNDSKGMGYKDSDDQWTAHESKFSSLLASLSGNVVESEEIKVSSLEKKSESSRARIHYRKFTRGKDLSRCSEKDLANIFGKRSLKMHKKIEQQVAEPSQPKEVEENNFSNGGLMSDYFKKKLTNFGNSGISTNRSTHQDSDSESEMRPSFGFGFQSSVQSSFVSYIKESPKKRPLEEPTEDTPSKKICSDNSEVNKKKKNKKIKQEIGLSNPGFDPQFNETVELETQTNELTDTVGEISENVQEVHPPKKKKKKKKSKESPVLEVEEAVKRKKKSKKDKENVVGLENPVFTAGDKADIQDIRNEQFEVKPKKKSKKDKEDIGLENPVFATEDKADVQDIRNEQFEVKRKKKKKKHHEPEVGMDNPALNLNNTIECDLMLNVTTTTPCYTTSTTSHQNNIQQVSPTKVSRRKSVRFSDVTRERIIPTKEDIQNETIDESQQDIVEIEGTLNDSANILNFVSKKKSKKQRNKGVENGGFDQTANQIEESVTTMSKTIETFQAEIENDINEAKIKSVELADIMVGEIGGDPNGTNEILPDGNVKLKFKHANFKKRTIYMENLLGPKKAYTHLIKGDIILGFKDTNLHEIHGYAVKNV